MTEQPDYAELLGFNALAGVRGFGVSEVLTDVDESAVVSMPWRAFGDSES